MLFMRIFIISTLLFSFNLRAQDFSDFSFSSFSSGSDSTLDTCRKPGHSCGECESDLQDDLNKLMNRLSGGKFASGGHWGDGKEANTNPSNIPMAANMTLDNTLKEIIELMKKHNPAGDNKLNFVVIGESESLQATSVKNGKIYPRIMLKSPNSELMVTFNTDPEARGYQALEMMRWNGRLGRYEFQELNFGDGGSKPHIDVSGNKCIECHKSPNPRPNWDTYRAWAGVVPSRDDMIEMHAKDGNYDHSKGIQPDGRAYLNFLDQIANDKDSGKDSRIAMLDIPFDDKRQLSRYVQDASKLSNREKVELIKRKVNDDGFYRVKHFPDKYEGRDNNISMNFDTKTAALAGSSQFAFDQMLAQNMCKVATELKDHPDFDKFKYPLALMFQCSATSRMSDIYPEEFKARVLDHYSRNKNTLADIERSRIPAGNFSNFRDLTRLVNEDTVKNHENADNFKFNRHGRFLNSYLTSVEGKSASQASSDAKYYSEKVVAPVHWEYHAIDDFGGVKGVPEGHTAEISAVRMLLEPFGVPVSHWSLVHGRDNAYNSFSFSDQFPLLQTQELFKQIRDEAGGCGKLEELTKVALAQDRAPAAVVAPDGMAELSAICGGGPNGNLLEGEALDSITRVVAATMQDDVKQSMTRCLRCHDKDTQIEFPGLRDFVQGDKEQEFLNYLGGHNTFYGMPQIDLFQMKLGLRPLPADGDFGYEMPPSRWNDHQEYAEKYGVTSEQGHEIRRKRMALYLSIVASGNKQSLRHLCDKVNGDNHKKDVKTNSGIIKNPKVGPQ
jgi:hypothetical protein